MIGRAVLLAAAALSVAGCVAVGASVTTARFDERGVEGTTRSVGVGIPAPAPPE